MQKKRTRQRKPRTVTVLQKLLESGFEFSITDAKHLNGSLFYLDWEKEHPNKELVEKRVSYQEKAIRQFEFPIFFEKKIESKIFFHFKRKAENLQKHAPKNKEVREKVVAENPSFAKQVLQNIRKSILTSTQKERRVK